MKLPVANGPVQAVSTPPPSKSITHRALVAAALSPGRTRLANPLDAEDTRLTAAGLQKLGAVVRRSSSRWWEIDGWPDGRPPAQGGQTRLQLGNSGTSLRLLMPVAALGARSTLFDGRPRLRRRPVGELVAALRRLGARVDEPSRPGCPPVVVTGPLGAGSLQVDAVASSQTVSGLLLAAPRTGGPCSLEVERLSSRPYVDLTVDVMRAFGVRVDVAGGRVFAVRPQDYASPGTYRVEADASSAAFLLAAAAVTGGRVRVDGVGEASIQGDRRFADLLGEMGCSVSRGEDWTEVSGAPARGLEADLNDVPDLVPPLTAVALHAPSPSRFTGVAHLRHKESDRLAALAEASGTLGGRVTVLDDGLEVRPGALHGGAVGARDDHRIAMAMAVAALTVPDVELDDPDCVGKSYPAFWDDWQALLAG